MTPTDVDRLWEFEQQWFADASFLFLSLFSLFDINIGISGYFTNKPQTNTNVLIYSDIFRNLIRPTLADHLDNWDNFASAGDDKEDYKGPKTPTSLAACADYCAADPECIQYRLTADLRCTTSNAVLRGKPSPGTQSGTMLWRVDAALEQMKQCHKVTWVTG
jgi:hypothetical protein